MPLFERDGVWWISVSHQGRRIRVSAGAGATKRQAAEIENKIRADIHANKLGKKPARGLPEAVKKWLLGECKRLKSAKKFESHARALIPYIKGKLLIDAPAVCNNIKQVMLDQELSPATINRRIAIIRRVCNLAYTEWQWLDKPVGDKISLLPEHNERHYYLLPLQVERLAQLCNNAAAGDMIRLAAYTGLRRSELFGLTQDNIRDGIIILDAKTKTERPRTVPVPQEALSILARIPLPLSDPMLRKSWDKARASAGLAHIHFHDLRHTYASWLVQAGIPLLAIQALMGHSSASMTRRYAHLDTSHLSDAVTRMTANLRIVK